MIGGEADMATVDAVIPFGFACLFWGVVLMGSVLFDGESYARENKPRWRVAVLSAALLALGVLCFASRLP